MSNTQALTDAQLRRAIGKAFADEHTAAKGIVGTRKLLTLAGTRSATLGEALALEWQLEELGLTLADHLGGVYLVLDDKAKEVVGA